jgi:hypothetical protein
LFDNCNAYYDVDSGVWSRASPELEFQQQMIPQICISLAFALHAVNHCLEVFHNPQEERRRVQESCYFFSIV